MNETPMPLATAPQTGVILPSRDERITMVAELLSAGMNAREVAQWVNAPAGKDDSTGRPWNLALAEVRRLCAAARKRLAGMVADLRNTKFQVAMIANGFLSDRSSLIAAGDFRAADVCLERYSRFLERANAALPEPDGELRDVTPNDDEELDE